MTEIEAGEDKPKLKPAEENPWYLLMTVHGPQPEGANFWNFDEDLHAKNRLDWNKWASRSLSGERRQELLEAKDWQGNPRFSSDELTEHSDVEWEILIQKFATRVKYSKISKLPTSVVTIDMSETDFSSFCAVNLIFPTSIDISGSNFYADADFSNAYIFNYFYCPVVSFFGMALFDDTQFLGYTSFFSSNFLRDAHFRIANFSRFVVFSDAKFSGDAKFLRSKFSGENYFIGTKFSKEHRADFSEAKFFEKTSFLNAELEGNTIFAGALFKKHPPSFHGAKLNEGTAFDRVDWPDPPPVPIKLPMPTSEEDLHKFDQDWKDKLQPIEDDISNYQRLKQIMETLKKHEDELDFFALEMATKRVLHRAKGEKGKAWWIWVYQTFSDCGRKVGLPIAWLALVVCLAFFGLVWTVECPLNDTKTCLADAQWHLLGMGKAMGLALTSAVGFLPFKKEIFGEVGAAYSTAAHIIMSIESLISAALLFLAGLGLRNRFRMK